MTKPLKLLIIPLFILYLAGLVYLILPGPVIPELPDSYRSQEPWDSGEIPGVWAYYSNFTREEAIAFYSNHFSRSAFLGLPLPQYRLNHPPEHSKEVIRDNHHAVYFEELVHPLRESLYISGWIPSEDPFQDQEELAMAGVRTDFFEGGRHYVARITLRRVDSPVWARLFIWTGIWVALWLMAKVVRAVIRSDWMGREKVSSIKSKNKV